MESDEYLIRVTKKVKRVALSSVSMTIVIVLSFNWCNSLYGSDYPWTYDNDMFGGPDFWGLIDRRWTMCSKGKMQSPINIDPSALLYDANLGEFEIDEVPVVSELVNVGQMPRIRILHSVLRTNVNVTNGPLATYKYRLQRIDVHFGNEMVMMVGSEHSIDQQKFPMEIQMLFYNSDLFQNFSSAAVAPHGLAAISVLVQLGDKTNGELSDLTSEANRIRYRQSRVFITDLKPWKLLPNNREYMTYEGSLTSPGCYETVTWIILNYPIYITEKDLKSWMKLMQTASDKEEPRYMSPNTRSLQEVQSRIIRTNIRHHFKVNDERCNKFQPLTYRSNSL